MTIGRQSDFMSTNQAPKQTVLERLHKKSISAKDIASQYWCEKQMELNCIYGTKFTPAMNKGMAIHQVMQDQVYKALIVEPVSYADRMYKTAYENILTLSTLMEKGVSRELKVYGSFSGYNIVGQIDELRMVDGKVVIVENKTTSDPTRLNPAFTRPHIVQTMLYRRMLDELRKGAYGYQNLDVYYNLSEMQLSTQFIDGLKSIGVKEDMLSIRSIYAKMFERTMLMPELSDSLIIHYVSRNTDSQVADMAFKYDENALNHDIKHAMEYWTGQREAAPVVEEEKWKCKPCRFFGKECKVWWQK